LTGSIIQFLLTKIFPQSLNVIKAWTRSKHILRFHSWSRLFIYRYVNLCRINSLCFFKHAHSHTSLLGLCELSKTFFESKTPICSFVQKVSWLWVDCRPVCRHLFNALHRWWKSNIYYENLCKCVRWANCYLSFV